MLPQTGDEELLASLEILFEEVDNASKTLNTLKDSFEAPPCNANSESENNEDDTVTEDNKNNKILDKENSEQKFNRKRKLVIPSINERTPKCKKPSGGILFEAFDDDSNLISPICKDFCSPLLPESTPVALNSKSLNSNIVNSTPIISHKDKLKAKSMLFSSSIDTTTVNTTENTTADEIDTLIAEITAICQEGLTSEAAGNEEDDEDCKIDITVLPVSGAPDAGTESDAGDTESQTEDDEDDTLVAVDKTGRFRDVTVVNVSVAVKNEVGDGEEDVKLEDDVLGLDEYRDEGMDEADITTFSKSALVTRSFIKEGDSELKKSRAAAVDTPDYPVTPEQWAARQRWRSTGTVDPEINLTSATTLRYQADI